MFPYIKQIKVNDCYTYKNFNVLDVEPDSFKHIILTGKNGSGKTTILNRIAFLLQSAAQGHNILNKIRSLKKQIAENPNSPGVSQWDHNLKSFSDIELGFFENAHLFGLDSKAYSVFKKEKGTYIFSYFKAHRKVDLANVESVTKETSFSTQVNTLVDNESFIRQFKQFIVNKKIYEAFDYMNNQTESINKNNEFFNKFTDILRSIFKDEALTLEFVKENFEFYLTLSNGQRLTFNQLSEGFSAFLNILVDLIMRVDLIKKNMGNFTEEPPGIVLIDEPETHLHIEMQYEILPLLTQLFPSIQFIIATHSPAIISSLEGATVFDLSSKTNVDKRVLGSSYSELMVKHFGVENEFGHKADKLIKELDFAYSKGDLQKVKDLFTEYEDILTISLKLEIESRIIELQSKNAAS